MMIITASDKRFEQYWDDLSIKKGVVSPFYSNVIQSYYAQRLKDQGSSVNDVSFFLLDQDKPQFGFRGSLIRDAEKTELLANEVPCASIEVVEHIKGKLKKKINSQLDSIINNVTGKFVYRDFLVSGRLSFLGRYMLKKGATISTMFSQIINLNADEVVLKRNIRKSYSSLINWGLREIEFVLLDNKTIKMRHIDEFRDLHIREAGRVTRSTRSWQHQLDIVKQEKAFVVMGYWNGELVTAGYFMYDKNSCYYGVSASRRDLFDKPLFHSVMWLAILHAKKIGCNWFESGQQLYPNYPSSPVASGKELGISDFKAGFGGGVRVFLDVVLNKHISDVV